MGKQKHDLGRIKQERNAKLNLVALTKTQRRAKWRKEGRVRVEDGVTNVLTVVGDDDILTGDNLVNLVPRWARTERKTHAKS